MKPLVISSFIALVIFLFSIPAISKKLQVGYLLEHEQGIGKNEPGPHNGTGSTTAYSFFRSAGDSRLVFRKRILHAGASIGYHLQKAEEIYYIVSGQGEMKMNNDSFPVKAGDAILTYPGSSHGLQQKGTEDLVVIINYLKEQ